MITLKTLLKNYYQLVNEAELGFLSSALARNGKTIFKLENTSDLKLRFKINSEDGHFFASTSLGLPDGSELAIKTVSLFSKDIKETTISIPVPMDNIIVSISSQTNPITMEEEIIFNFQEKVLYHLMKNGFIVKDFEKSLLSYRDIKKVFNIIFLNSWIEPKLLLRSVIDTEKFETANYEYYFTEGTREGVSISTPLYQIEYAINNLRGSSRKDSDVKEAKKKRELMFWTIEALISEDAMGFSTEVLKDSDLNENPNHSNKFMSEFLSMVDPSKKDDYRYLGLKNLIEEGSLNETSSPTLFYIAKKFIPEN